ncbi:hypothetical protein BJF79_44215 [Actinomadura sp. CNU-125]|uniref:hypothetical protein n=1 Tax=Actinomadura sp. CNU-125 TaxID=1904961 RepID=UPI000962018B|nr:hypothetical protein [Actinomadura sp. CNU-125]OLT25481.1 hypothetical protein BJF79_44215 [Actinomadura sp. CNU-125]
MPQEAAGSRQGVAARPDVQTESHAVGNGLAAASITIGIAALILGWVPSTHLAGAIAAVIGLPLALYSQMVSGTINQRWLNVIGMVAAFLGGAFALSHGGFSV